MPWATLLELLAILPGLNCSEGRACSAEGFAEICWSSEILWHLFSCLVHRLFKDCLVCLGIILNTSKDYSERDILRVNSWINKTLQNEHCCWSRNTEIFWLHHLIGHTRDNEFYGTCNILSFSWQAGIAIIRIYRISDLLMPQRKKMR